MPAVPKRIRGEQKRELTPDQWQDFIAAYLQEKSFAEAATKRVNDKKATVIAFLKEHGETDEKGSLYVDVEGVDGVGSMKYERRVGQTLDTAKVQAWLVKHGLWEEYSEEIRVLDADKLAGAAYEGGSGITERVYQGFFVDNESWALKSVK